MIIKNLFIFNIMILMLGACDQHSEKINPIAAGSDPSEKISIKVSPHTQSDIAQYRVALAHSHGAGSMSVILEKSELNISLSVPAINLTGFEHTAHSKMEQQKVDDILRILKTIDSVMRPAYAATCVIIGGNITTNLLDSEVSLNEHADIDISYTWSCKHPDHLTDISVPLLLNFASIQRLSVNWIMDGKQGAQELNQNNPVLHF